MEIKAIVRNLRISPRKVRLVADQIRGKGVSDALLTLHFVDKKASLPFKNLIESGIANAQHNLGIVSDGLVIKTVLVDGGPMMKRFMPRAMGRAAAIQKKTSHITILLVPKEEIPKKKIKKRSTNNVSN